LDLDDNGKRLMENFLKDFNSNKPADSKIIELVAKKVNSGSKKEFISVEIENI